MIVREREREMEEEKNRDLEISLCHNTINCGRNNNNLYNWNHWNHSVISRYFRDEKRLIHRNVIRFCRNGKKKNWRMFIRRRETILVCAKDARRVWTRKKKKREAKRNYAAVSRVTLCNLSTAPRRGVISSCQGRGCACPSVWIFSRSCTDSRTFLTFPSKQQGLSHKRNVKFEI